MTATLDDRAGASAHLVTPVDHWLAEQAALSAVEHFAGLHDAGVLDAAGYVHREVLPAAAPGPGQQYAFAVALDSCTGCKACVAACHSLNGLDEGEAWRSVGVLYGVGDADQQTVPTGCHHCAEPACLTGCPVDAYEKDPLTGIVVHLDDQCIGCAYCTLTCPYEVPRYNARLGIVRKCDLCRGRLKAGEAPACVQGCPNEAISITVVDVAAVRASTSLETAGAGLVAGAPRSSITVPTTRFTSAKDVRVGMRAADEGAISPAHAHPPLAVMLVLTQLSVGTFAVALALRLLGLHTGGDGRLRGALAVVGLGAGLLALAASTLHLGRPRYAYRAVIGFRHSWLSREIVAFGAFAGLATLYAGATLVGGRGPAVDALGAGVVAAGVSGVGCSVALYAVTGRRWWRASASGPKFALTALAGGLATVLTAMLAVGGTVRPGAVTAVAVTLAATVAVELALQGAFLRHRRPGAAARGPELHRSALLLTGALGRLTWIRFLTGGAGGLVAPLVAAALWTAGHSLAAPLAALLGLVTLIAGELVERWQFFRASSPPRMPGGLP